MGCDNCLGLPAAGQSGGVGQQPADLGAQEVWIRVIEMPGGGRRATGEIGCAYGHRIAQCEWVAHILDHHEPLDD